MLKVSLNFVGWILWIRSRKPLFHATAFPQMTNPHLEAFFLHLRTVGRMGKGKKKTLTDAERAARRLRMAHARSFRWKNLASVGNPCEHVAKPKKK